jgi:hypothetical protein
MTKVITKERLIELREKHKLQELTAANCLEYALIIELIDECQELDNLTFTRLRPMSDAPEEVYFLVKTKHGNDLVEACLSHPGYVHIKGMDCPIKYCEGWITMPEYKPEQS